MTELVVLADPDGHRIGTMPKSEVHHGDTPLHLAFSCYVFDPACRLLVTRRALDKATFPGLETNTVCGHPAPEEQLPDAVVRRAAHELGLTLEDVRLILPDFAYRAEFHGVVEHELCPVFAAFVGGDARLELDPTEVERAVWEPWERFATEVLSGARDVSPWSREQVGLLAMLGPDPRVWPTSPLSELPPAFDPDRP
ncbi:MAG: isopentenyl-diphosphate Delta-isomerase [Actinomycetales bacterium]|nr:isopentenyl-diphosphate Delta-isomerase [Actinomycetales bacterium]